MKRFLKKFILFSSPIIVIIICLESLILILPNTFRVKANFIKKNKDIDVLVLGSSHNQDAINPVYISMKTANLAYSQQDIELDSALFFNYVSSLSNLKFLIIEMSYHTLIRKNEIDYWRYPWYYKYHGISIVNLSTPNKLFIYSSSPDFFNKHIIDFLNPNIKQPTISKYGFAINRDNQVVFKQKKYNVNEIYKDLKKRKKHIFNTPKIDHSPFNKSKINAMISYCTDNNISVILLSAPTYKSFYENYRKSENQKRINYTDSLLSQNKNVCFLNFEQDIRFKVTNFKDDDHLSASGSKKFTKILNEKIDSINQINIKQ